MFPWRQKKVVSGIDLSDWTLVLGWEVEIFFLLSVSSK